MHEKKSLERARLASILTARRMARKYHYRPSNGLEIAYIDDANARPRMPIEQVEKLLADARRKGDAKFERLKRMRAHSIVLNELVDSTERAKNTKKTGVRYAKGI